MATFSVTYDIVTPESAENGDVEESGFVERDVTLRVAICAVRATRTNAVDGVECIATDSSPAESVRWITISNGQEFETGAQESRSLHIPDSVSCSSSRRIARFLGARIT